MEENPQERDSYEREEEYIVEESPEISVGEAPYVRKALSYFPAFANRNYRLYFCGQLVSVSGTWLQIVTQSWLVLQLTHSALLLGLVAALANIPIFFLSLFSGVIIDKFPKKQILIFTQSSFMVLAFILGILTVLNIVTVFEICLLAFCLGIITAIDSPTRQSFVPEFVTKDQLASAIALNSGIFNAARVIGPAIAGILIVLTGTGGAFIINGISYIAVIIALFAMKVELYVSKKGLRMLAAIKEGLSYSFSHPTIRVMLMFVGVSSIFAWSYSTMLPIIAKYTFHFSATGLGYLYVAIGLGAVTATLLVSAFSKKISPVIFIFGGNALFAVGIFLFTLTNNFMVALLFLFSAGFGLLAQFTTMNATIQRMVTNELRGRVTSVYAFMFLGLAPIGNFEVGFLSDRFGTSLAIQIGALIVFVFGMLLFINRKRILGDLKQIS